MTRWRCTREDMERLRRLAAPLSLRLRRGTRGIDSFASDESVDRSSIHTDSRELNAAEFCHLFFPRRDVLRIELAQASVSAGTSHDLH